jgi:hypothetical protein
MKSPELKPQSHQKTFIHTDSVHEILMVREIYIYIHKISKYGENIEYKPLKILIPLDSDFLCGHLYRNNLGSKLSS